MSEDFRRPKPMPVKPELPQPEQEAPKKRGRPKKPETVQIVILHHNQMTPEGRKVRGDQVTVPCEFAETVLAADAEAERDPRIMVIK